MKFLATLFVTCFMFQGFGQVRQDPNAHRLPEEKDMSAYLMVYFKDETHSIHMAVSSDGYTFTDVNRGRPVIAGDTIADQKGVRDPHIFRGPDGAFYLTMTDLHIYAQREGLRDTEWERDGKEFGWGNNKGIILMKSYDLLHWQRTNIRMDVLFPEMNDIGCAWAPQTTFDEEEGKLMIYFSMRRRTEPERIYYMYVNEDFNRIESAPQLLFAYPKDITYIDGDITKVGNQYHLFYVSHDGTPGIKQAVSTEGINRGYSYDPHWYDPEPTPCEAPNVWKRIGEDKWVLMYDVYGIRPHNFGFSETSDFKTFTDLGHFNKGVMKTSNFVSPKHGAVVHITAEELMRLQKQWKFDLNFNAGALDKKEQLLSPSEVRRQVQAFPLHDVQLLDGPFRQAQQTNLAYIHAMDPDRLLAPFLREAGLSPKAVSYSNWENTGLDGHIGGHYLSALSLAVAATGDQESRTRLNYTISELKRCQDANGNGYIGGVPGGKAIWQEVATGNIKAGSFSLNGKWVPLYNIHKTYAGLRDAWLYTGNATAKEMLIKMTDWAIRLVSQLSDEQIQDMLRSEYGGLNETFADVAAITGDAKYLHLAQQFSHHFILDPLRKSEDKLDGLHANTQIPKVIGFQRIAELGGDADWSTAADFFWNTIVENRSVSIGGNSANEHFHAANDFSRMIASEQGPETCNTYNMLRLSKMLYEISLDKKYMDYYERAMYNHILSTQHPDNGGLVYFTPMRPGHYRVYSQPHTSMWCCVGSGIENHSKYGEMIYAYSADEVFVNLFIPSHLDWKEQRTMITQETRFPEEEKTTVVINPEEQRTFTVSVRYPEWVKDGALKLWVNGKKQKVVKSDNGYVSVRRKWKKGDRIEIQLPMHVYTEQLPDGSDYFSFLYGPIVLAAKTGTNDLKDLYADDSRMAHVAGGQMISLKEMPILVEDQGKLAASVQPVVGKPLTFKLSHLYPEEKWGNVELEPFYGIHDARYIIYWPQTTSEGLVEMQEETERNEQARMRRDAVTVDVVSAGEQQPESDHFIQMERSATGYTEGIHWREAKGWFSYQLQNKEHKGAYLHLTYLDQERNRQCDVLLNDTVIGRIALSGGNGEQLFEALYPIPEDLRNEKTWTLRVQTQSGTTAQIVQVRVLRDKPL